MKLIGIVVAGVLTSMLSVTAFAQSSAVSAPPLEMLPGGMPMDPAVMQNMEQMRQQRMAQGQGGAPMMSGGNNGMMMDPAMMQYMMQMRQQRMGQGGSMGQPGGHHPGGGMNNGMMNPQMMQNMMKVRQQHMSQLNNRLDRIESKLDQLLSRQK